MTPKSELAPPRNPLMSGPLAIACLSLAVWLVAGYIVLRALQDYADATAALAWTGIGATVGFAAFLFWLLARTLSWKSSAN